MQRCPKCKSSKNDDDFYKNPKTKSGFSTYCKSCAINATKFSPSRKPERRKQWRDSNIESEMLGASKKRAKAKNLPHTITREDIIIPDVCPVFGIRMYPGTGRGAKHDAPSLDRIRPELGYIPGNVRVISYLANAMKRDASPEQLRLFAEWVLREGESG